MSNELENTNFPLSSTRPFERLERSSELKNRAPAGVRLWISGQFKNYIIVLVFLYKVGQSSSLSELLISYKPFFL